MCSIMARKYQPKGPSIYDVHTKIGFLANLPPVHMSLTPSSLVDIHMFKRPSKKDPFSQKFFRFWVSSRQIFYISSAKIFHKNSIFTRKSLTFFKILCVDVHMRLTPLSPVHMRPHRHDPLRVDVINEWPLKLAPRRLNGLG